LLTESVHPVSAQVLEKYILVVFGLQASFIFVSVCLGFFRRGEGLNDWTIGGADSVAPALGWPSYMSEGESIDLCCLGAFSLAFVLGHAWFCWRMFSEHRSCMRAYDRFATADQRAVSPAIFFREQTNSELAVGYRKRLREAIDVIDTTEMRRIDGDNKPS
jgi:hypothetical protein